MLRTVFILLIVLISATSVPAQEADDFLDAFFTVQEGEEVYLRWTIKGGNTCDGTRIQHSLDNIYYEEVGEISGICGSADRPVSYDFTHLTPAKNKVNYYRLELGRIGMTSPQAISVIILNDDGYSIQPNPVTSRSKILFSNPDGVEIEFYLFDIMGRMVMSETTTEDHVWVEGDDLKRGTYVFFIRNEQQILSKGKLIVL